METAARSTGFGWRRLLAVAIVLNIITTIAVMVVNGEFIPPALVPVLFWIVGLALLDSRRRLGLVLIGLATVYHIVTGIAFAGESLGHPESFADFFLFALTIVWSVIAMAGVGAVWRGEPRPSATPRNLAIAGVVLSLILGGYSLIATAGEESVAAQPGDIRVVAEDVEFRPTTIDAEAGELAVHVDNEDLIRHTLVIDELDVDLELPGSKAQRVTFQAESGEYEFYCSVPGHEDMTGTLNVR